MPICDPRDGFFFPTLTLMMDSYILAQNADNVACSGHKFYEFVTRTNDMLK